MAEAKKPASKHAAAKRTASGKHAAGSKDAQRGDDAKSTRDDFAQAVNMGAAELMKWLDSPESRKVGFKGEDSSGKESVGHRSGRRIVRLLGKPADALTDGDLAHMRKVAGYVRRHLAQRPKGDVRETPWRYSLMNWGHDPLHARSART